MIDQCSSTCPLITALPDDHYRRIADDLAAQVPEESPYLRRMFLADMARYQRFHGRPFDDETCQWLALKHLEEYMDERHHLSRKI